MQMFSQPNQQCNLLKTNQATHRETEKSVSTTNYLSRAPWHTLKEKKKKEFFAPAYKKLYICSLYTVPEHHYPHATGIESFSN